jgi:hypothetical protein
VAATLATTGPSASAHVCAAAAVIPVGVPANISIGVTVENEAVPDVEIDVPATVSVDRIEPKAHWRAVRTAASVRYRGGPVVPFTCEYFSLVVTARTKGRYDLPVTQRRADGTVIARATSGPTEQLVYAGIKPPSPPSQTGGTSPTMIAGLALIGLAVVFVGAMAWRRRRDRGADEEAARDAELRERLDEFKKRMRE